MGQPLQYALVFAVALLSWALTYETRRRAHAHGLLDVPNYRSSHVRPTPRGGGIAIVVASNVGLLVLLFLGSISRVQWIALLGGLAVAAIGFMDDHKAVPTRRRLAVHFAAACWSLGWVGGVPPLQIGTNTVQLGLFGFVFGAVAIVWTINLFNFMDGIDGLAASEALCIFGGVALLSAGVAPSGSIFPAVMVLAAACAGFLVWNWPPASIFMGDVGSGYLGFMVAALALTAGHAQSAAPFVWLTLGSVFFVDSTVTLVRRALRRERLDEAHRSHAYQWLSRRWNSHLRVTTVVIMLDLGMLLPLAYVELAHAPLAAGTTAITLIVLTAVALLAGSGRAERRLD